MVKKVIRQDDPNLKILLNDGSWDEGTKREALSEIEMALFQIHSLADVLEDKAMGDKESTNDKISNPILSIAQIIGEKANFCLKVIDKIRADEKVDVTA